MVFPVWKSKNQLKDIRLWIIFFFVIRLYGITNPPLEVAHNWRQTTVTMVARNFCEEGADLFHPKIDIAGEKTGITGMEFPVFNYIIFLVSKLFGYDHWYGRLINLIVSSFGIFYFYRLIKKYFTKEHAFYSTLILLCSIWFSFSRKIIPDTFATSLALIGLYYGTNYLDNKNSVKNLAVFFIFTLLGILSKISTAYLLPVLLLFYLNKKIELKNKIILSFNIVLILIPVIAWYFYWVPHLVNKYQFWHFFMGKSFMDGLYDIAGNLGETAKRFYDTALKYTGFAAFIYGITIALLKKNKKLIWIFVILFISFSIFIIKTGYNFYHHTYYIIPFVPVMAWMAGYTFSLINNKKLIYFFLSVIALEGIVNQISDFKIKEEYNSLLMLENDLDKFTGRHDLIVINSVDYNPTPMYFANRKGWLATNEELQDTNYVRSIAVNGARYEVVLKVAFGNNFNSLNRQVYENDYYKINQIDIDPNLETGHP